MPSLALIFHLIDAVSGVGAVYKIGLRSVRMAAEWCDFLKAHAIRLYELGSSDIITAANAILDHIRSGDLSERFTARKVSRKQWSGLTDNALIRDALTMLVAHNYLDEIAISGTGRPTIEYIVNERLL